MVDDYVRIECKNERGNIIMENTMGPKEYFDLIKNKKHKMTEKDLDGVYNNCLRLARKAKITGQVKALKKLLFHIENIEIEKKALDLGLDTFIYDICEVSEGVLKEWSTQVGELKLLRELGSLFS